MSGRLFEIFFEVLGTARGDCRRSDLRMGHGPVAAGLFDTLEGIGGGDGQDRNGTVRQLTQETDVGYSLLLQLKAGVASLWVRAYLNRPRLEEPFRAVNTEVEELLLQKGHNVFVLREDTGMCSEGMTCI